MKNRYRSLYLASTLVVLGVTLVSSGCVAPNCEVRRSDALGEPNRALDEESCDEELESTVEVDDETDLDSSQPTPVPEPEAGCWLRDCWNPQEPPPSF